MCGLLASRSTSERTRTARVCVCGATEDAVGHTVTSKERNVLENLSSSYSAAKDALNYSYSINEAHFQHGHARLVPPVECPTGC